jgi:hypothetical protein
MPSRRTLLAAVGTTVAGGVIAGLAGSAAATPHRVRTLHDVSRVDGAETTLSARINPAVREAVGLPSALEPVWSDLTGRYSAVDPDRLGPVSVSIALENDRVVGSCAVANGGFDGNELRADLEAANVHRVSPTTFGGTDVERFVRPDRHYAVGLTDSKLAVGYGPNGTAALAHATSAVESDPYTPGDAAPEPLDGDAVAYATLGRGTRSALSRRAAGTVEGIDTIAGNAEALGVALDPGPQRSQLMYAVAADQSSLSSGELWRFARRATAGEDAVDVESVSRSEGLFVVDATVATDALWDAHEPAGDGLSA